MESVTWAICITSKHHADLCRRYDAVISSDATVSLQDTDESSEYHTLRLSFDPNVAKATEGEMTYLELLPTAMCESENDLLPTQKSRLLADVIVDALGCDIEYHLFDATHARYAKRLEHSELKKIEDTYLEIKVKVTDTREFAKSGDCFDYINSVLNP